jgi:hypothetical protein
MAQLVQSSGRWQLSYRTRSSSLQLVQWKHLVACCWYEHTHVSNTVNHVASTLKPTSPRESSPIPRATTQTTLHPNPAANNRLTFVRFLILMDKHCKEMRITQPRTSNHGFDFTLPFSISVRGLIIDLIFSGQGRREALFPEMRQV